MKSILLVLGTVIVNGMEGMDMAHNTDPLCPICPMHSVQRQDTQLVFQGNQLIYFCDMNHYTEFFDKEKAKAYIKELPSSNVKVADLPKDIACPVSKTSIQDCPVQEIRKLVFTKTTQQLYVCGEENASVLRNNVPQYLATSHLRVPQTNQATAAASPYCVGNGSVMRNGFFDSSNTCLIFIMKPFVLNTPWKFLIAMVVAFILAMVAEWFRLYRGRLTKRIIRSSYIQTTITKEVTQDLEPVKTSITLASRILIASFYATQLAQAYLLMIIAMTFSISLFLSLILGFAIGNVLFDNNFATITEQQEPQAQACHA